MGGNASPLLASLTLGVMEYRYLTASINRPIALGLKYVRRYIDDLLILNAVNFQHNAPKIYHHSLSLDYSALNATECAFLDLKVQIKPGLKINVYNKTDAFDFTVSRFGFPCSDVHSSVHYAAFGSQVLRFAAICTHKVDFSKKVVNLYHLLCKRGFSSLRLIGVFLKTYCRHSYEFIKFGFHSRLDVTHFVVLNFD